MWSLPSRSAIISYLWGRTRSSSDCSHGDCDYLRICKTVAFRAISVFGNWSLCVGNSDDKSRYILLADDSSGDGDRRSVWVGTFDSHSEIKGGSYLALVTQTSVKLFMFYY